MNTSAALLSLCLALPISLASATTFRVDAESDPSQIVRVPCASPGPCCNSCHTRDVAQAKKVPPHTAELFRRYQMPLTANQRIELKGGSYVTEERGELVLYKDKRRQVLPARTMLIKDPSGRVTLAQPN